ncbi:putative transporter [Sinorhizobium fredii NGR234]|uniref:Transporter n=1 Tax=Sinorhizobium fredii (strain NBRC 101917 / NGR234) TaxID=394 RepID=C3MFD6_SINFN|nr:MFS transporter [Sinorhizobium fredii]ACP25993.1 putative transporter [Sinorhizobium fredii NGR234]
MLLPSIKPQQSSGLAQVPAVLRNRKTQVGLLAAVLIFIGQFAAYTYITPFLNRVSHIDAAVLSALLLGYGIAGFIGNLFGGWAVGRNLRLSVSGTAALISLSAFGLAITGDSALAATIWTLAWGFGFGMLPIAMQTYMFSSAPDQLESVAALFVSTAQLAIGAGALVGGLAVDHFGVASALVIGGVAALLTALLVGASTGKQ